MLDSRRAIVYIINCLHPLVAVKFVFLLDGPPQIRPFLHFFTFPSCLDHSYGLHYQLYGIGLPWTIPLDTFSRRPTTSSTSLPPLLNSHFTP